MVGLFLLALASWQIKSRHLQSKSGKIDDSRTRRDRDEQVGPHGEGLVSEVGEDNLGGHTAKAEADSDAKQDEMVVVEKSGVWRKEPAESARGEGDDGEPFEEDGEDRESVPATSANNVADANSVSYSKGCSWFENIPEWHMSDKDGAQEDGDPEVAQGVVAKESLEANLVGDGSNPHGLTIISACNQYAAGNNQTLGRSIDVSQVQHVSVIGFPGRKPHGNSGQERREDTSRSCSQAHSRNLADTGQSAVQRVDSVVKEFTEGRAGSSPARLLSVKVVHGRVHPESKSKGVVDPRWCRSDELREVDDGEGDIRDNESKADEGDEVRGHPPRQEGHSPLPLNSEVSQRSPFRGRITT